MALIVQKFGGTSVGSLERIHAVANIVAKAHTENHQIVVVVSAMGGETDRLVELAHSISHKPSPREYAVLLSTGEQVSMSLLSMALHKKGIEARSFTGMQANILTDDNHRSARISNIDTSRLTATLEQGQIAIVAGFQGYNLAGDITTLGRGGSDTTAVALAAALKAKECQIYTDVEGVYTTDPKVVPDARLLRYVTFEEMLELASLGAKVLQIRAVEFASKYNIPIRVLSSFEEKPGTLITDERTNMEQPLVSGVAFNRSEAKVTVVGVPDKPGVAHKILGTISDKGIDIDMIIQNVGGDNKTDFTFTVNREDFEDTLAITQQVVSNLGAATVLGDTKIAKLSLVGVGMRSHAGIASKMFKVLADEGINIQMISTSEIKVSVIIDEKYTELGVRALHAAFELGNAPTEEFDPLSKV